MEPHDAPHRQHRPPAHRGGRGAGALGRPSGSPAASSRSSSPRRCSARAETAELAGFGDRAELDEDLRERDYGEYEGLTTKEIRRERPGWDVWRDDCPRRRDAGAGRRARRSRRSSARWRPDGDTLVFAHAHLLRTLGARWIGIGPEGGGKLVLGTAAVCVLGFERERRVLRRWNS